MFSPGGRTFFFTTALSTTYHEQLFPMSCMITKSQFKQQFETKTKAIQSNPNQKQTKTKMNRSSDRFPKRIHTKDWQTKPPCAVIVTIYSGHREGSYDNLYREVEPQSPDPESSIALFEMNYNTIPYVFKFMKKQQEQQQAQQSSSSDEPAIESISVEESSSFSNSEGEREKKKEKKGSTLELIQNLFDAIAQVQPDSVVFNFECCGGCSERGFPDEVRSGNPQNESLSNKKSPASYCQPSTASTGGYKGSKKMIMVFLRMLIDRGFMAVFGDFSLKALINDWDDHLLGANPFEAMPQSSCGSSMLLAFDSQELLRCPSSQLQMLGRLNDGINTANLHCMSGTIVCTLKDEEERLAKQQSLREKWTEKQAEKEKEKVTNPEKQQHSTTSLADYELEVLTIATVIDGRHVTTQQTAGDRSRILSLGSNADGTAIHQGYLGHAIIKYNHVPNAGSILVSSGHWIELTRVGSTDEEKILTCMKEQYGEVYKQQLEEEFNSCSNDRAKRSEIAQRSARQLVQSSAPSNYSKRGTY